MSGPPTHLAYQVTGAGWQENGKLMDVPVPDPSEGQVLCQMRPINPTDIIQLTTGRFAVASGPVPLPFVPGSEGVGRVHKNGPGCSKFREGQRVVGVPWPRYEGRGTWQQYVAVQEHNLLAVPDDIHDDVAAQLWINPVTVVGLIQLVGVKEGDWLLQSAASSVLGRQVIQLCKHKGIRTINVVRRDSAKQACLDAGGDAAISTESEDIVKRVKEITGGAPVSGVLDAVAGKLVGELVKTLGKGKLVLYGVLSYPEPIQLDALDLLSSGATIETFRLGTWIAQPAKGAILQHVLELLQQKIIQPSPARRQYKLEEVREAIVAAQESGQDGKIMLYGP